jgi:hypothetical protein
VTLPVTLQSSFAGSQPIAMFARDQEGLTSGAWQTRGTWTIPAAVASHNPSADSVTPASGSGLSATFRFQYSHPDGVSQLVWNSAQIGLSQVNGCYLAYHYPSNGLFLANDANTAWLGPLAPGSAASVRNSQCTITGGGAAISASGNVLTVTLPVTFQSGFAGTQPIQMFTYDRFGVTSGAWQTRGTWTIP